MSSGNFGGTPSRLPGVPTGQTPIAGLGGAYGGMGDRNISRGESSEGIAGGGQAGAAASANAKALADSLKLLSSAVQGAAAALSYLGQGGPLGAFGTAVGGVLAPLQGLVVGVAQAIGPMSGLASGVGQFLGALNPGLMQALSFSMRELLATFGMLVEPIAQELAPLFRELAASLQPAFRALAPVIGTLAEAFGKVAAVLVGVFAQILTALAPVFEVLANLVRDVVEALAPLLTIVGSLVEVFAPVVKLLVGVLAPVIQFVVKAFIYLTAAILGLVGATGTLDAMLKALNPERGPQSSGLQALQNSQYKTFEGLGRDLALSAAIATGSPDKEKTQSQYLKDITETLKGWRDFSTESLWNRLQKAVYQGVADAISGVKRAIYEAGGESGEKAFDTLNPLDWSSERKDYTRVRRDTKATGGGGGDF